MSLAALKIAGTTRNLNPEQKLTLFELAFAHHQDTGRCNPSPELIAQRSGLSERQVRRALRGLIEQNVLTFTKAHPMAPKNWNFRIEKEDENLVPVPDDYWPDEAVIEDLHLSFPNHDFSIGEIVDDFKQFARRRRIRFAPGGINAAFHTNATALLRRRRPGKVEISGQVEREQPSAVYDLLSRHSDT